MSLIIKKNTTFKIPRDPILWKIAIFGAGTATSNGEYVWDGSEVNGGFPVYRSTSQSDSTITREVGGGPNGTGTWNLFDADYDDTSYQIESFNFSGNWFLSNGLSQVPSSIVSYVQDSFISSVTLVDAGAINSNGTFSRTSGGSTQFDKAGSPNFIFDDGSWVVADFSAGTDTYTSSNYIFNWSANQVQFEPPPTVSSITYSA